MKPSKEARTTRRKVDSTPAKADAERVEGRARKSSNAPVRVADVARYAGVSTASVSRAINEPGLVSDEIREKVMRAVEILNWVPNGAAAALSSQRSRTIGAVIPSLGSPNFGTMVEALQGELAEANYTLVLGCAPSREPNLREQLVRKMVQRGVEGVVLVGETQPATLLELLKVRRIPCVMSFSSGKSAGNICIGFDNYLASARITRHLLELGHRSFGMVTESAEGNDRIQERIAGVKDTLAQAGLGIKPHHYAEVDSPRRIESGRGALKHILADSSDRPTAIICSNDYLAIGVMIEAASLKIPVPNELSVTGVDDINLSAHFVPALTTIRVPGKQMGVEIARYLIRYLESGAAPLPAPLEAEFVMRDSTAPPPPRTHS